ncbi:MAG: IS110 family transposase [Elusimicrobia bacterium]|nr:IS110 family transposase [Elusimicrobiota bacterium]
MVYIGCDQHKFFCQLAVLDEEGKMIHEQKLYHDDREALKHYFTSLPPGSEMAIEASGFESWLADFAQSLGIKVHLSHPLKTRAIAEAKIKTDKVDAKILAQLLYADLLPHAYLAPPEIRRARYFLRFRLCLNRYRSSIKNRVHSLLHFLGISSPAVADLFGVRGRQFLDSLKLGDGYQEALQGYLGLLDAMEARINCLKKRLAATVKENPDAKLLESIPGIGVLLSQLIVAEIGEISRFPSAEKLCSYAGLVPSLHQSGQTLYRGSCQRQGNKFLRWAAVEAAQVASRKDPLLKAFYDRIKRKKGSQKATVALARKLTVIVYQILTKKEPYHYHTYSRQARTLGTELRAR